jgi:predicted enzyme related to lactoylglutathione lyase
MPKRETAPAAKTTPKPAAKTAPDTSGRAHKAPAKKAATRQLKTPTAAPFCWYELVTTDPRAAAAFYRSVVGWTAKDAGQPGVSYTLLLAKEHMVAGLMAINEEMKQRNVPPCWTGYVAVANTDAYVKKVVAAGGKLHRPAADIPGVGRFALVTDPHGAAFFLFTPIGENPNQAPVSSTPGHVGWHELYAGDLEAAFKFYAKLFGWTKSTAIDMGPMGTYQLFAINGEDKGGMMTKPPHIPVAMWGYYFNVAALGAALGRVTKGKGKVLNGPMQVPGGSWIAQCVDPQGAHFSLVAPKP